ncbi:substrate-binding domain-containing protein [Novosphingobium sp.]|uniref:PstS family phosphate ABC transporter substrate-binding protein n=1 Tax=Novosphingobium sp. TaxID=1874826 RepID=UPI00163DD839|nr:substrate-binding domain-containing protein [Novosphingobium sp.]
MKAGRYAALLAAALVPLAAFAQEGAIPEPKPLVARYRAEDGRLTIGGGPEAEQVAGAAAGKLTARISGPDGAVPLLTQGTVMLAILPRTLTAMESAAVRRFSGGVPFTLPLMQGLYAHLRRDAAGTVDARALPIAASLLAPGGQTALTRSLPAYKPLSPEKLDEARQALSALPGATYAEAGSGYRAKDGTLAIVGSDTLTELLPDILQAYARRAPDVRFTTDLRGSSTAMPALSAGTSLIAPMGREAWQNDIDAFRQVKGYAPTRIRIAYASHGPRPDGKTPPAIYVNASNPVSGLTMEQVRRIFAAGADGGDIADWGQLQGAPHSDRSAPIHVYGARDDGGFGTAMRLSKLDGLPFSARYRSMASGKAILAAVAADPLAIGYATWMDAGDAPAGVRVLPLSKRQGSPYVLPAADGHRGEWPISYFFNVYVDARPEAGSGSRTAPEAKALLRFLLSDQGQSIIARHSREENGYLPLDSADLAEERAKVEAL